MLLLYTDLGRPRGTTRPKRALITRGPLTRYVELRVADAPGILETFSSAQTSRETAS